MTTDLLVEPTYAIDPPSDREMTQYLHPHSWFLIFCNLTTLCFVAVASLRLSNLGWPIRLVILAGASSMVWIAISGHIMVMSRPSFSMAKHRERLAAMDEWPTVDVFLPVCGEPIEVLCNTWTHVAQLAYPGSLRVHVLDDSTTYERGRLAESFGFDYIRRPNRGQWKKAGNVKYAFDQTNGEFILILDADFAPRHDMVQRLLAHMDADIGIVQSPQFFRARNAANWLSRGAGSVQEFFYRAVQPSRNELGGAICVGTCALYRRAALDSNGGPTLIEHSEDVHTGFDIAQHGWKLRYIPLNLSAGACPDTLSGFYKQQYRWCMGSMSLLRSAKFWRAKLTINQRLCFASGFLYYLSTAVKSLTAPLLPALLLIAYPSAVVDHGVATIAPALIFAFIVFPAWHTGRYGMETWSVKQVYAWAHLLAIADIARGSVKPWEPTGAKGKSKAEFRRFFFTFSGWHIVVNALVVVLAGWRLPSVGFDDMWPLLAFTAFTTIVSARVVRLGLQELKGGV